MEKDPRLYLEHMLEAITHIELDTEGYDFERFRRDRRARQLVERNLEIISEASRRIPQTAKDAESQIPCRAIAGIGNVIRHDYHALLRKRWCVSVPIRPWVQARRSPARVMRLCLRG
jgi:uncharacterized protein with HEPN domain